MKEEQLRIEEDEAQTRKRLKADREHKKKWEADREVRVGTWRDFAKGNKSKKVPLSNFKHLTVWNCSELKLEFLCQIIQKKDLILSCLQKFRIIFSMWAIVIWEGNHMGTIS